MIIPVIDIKDNECVSGKSGNRDTYSKLDSVYGNNPIDIAHNLKKAGYNSLYIADLDKIEKKSDNDELISNINQIIPVILDNGISDMKGLLVNEKISSYSIIATECIDSLDNLVEMLNYVDTEKIFLSMDIKNNELLIKNKNIALDEIIKLINNMHIKHLIILNISNVGTKTSNITPLEDYIIKNTPNSTHIIGGGITDNSIKKYNEFGIDNFLIGTILHQGFFESDNNLGKNYEK